MTKPINMIPLNELNLTNRFLFDEVMEDPGTHQDVLSIILGRDIPLIQDNKTEKELRKSPSMRSVRMDVFAVDEDQTVYNTEMQSQKKMDLARRSRYYQSMIDTTLLEPGIPDYSRLNASYIIIIMPFDLFGFEKYCYTFEASCLEVPKCRLQDGARRIFLNTKGKNDDEVSTELVEFLHYVEHTTDAAAARSDSVRLKRIHQRVRKVRASEEIGVKYMQAWEERYFDKLESREEGRKEGIEIGKEEGRAIGLAEGREKGREEGRTEGQMIKLQELIKKKLAKGKAVEEIADDLEESIDTIERLVKEIL